jgi:hypothetical protein
VYRLALLINIGLLGLALAPLPYGYYELLRMVSCPIFVYGAYLSHTVDRKFAVWIFGTLAVLYNPVVKVHSQREVWALINLATIAFLLAMLWKLPTWMKAKDLVPESPQSP